MRPPVPVRVMVSAHYDATGPEEARRQGVDYDVVFVRRDGWTLGAPASLADKARACWAGEWIEEWRRCCSEGAWEKVVQADARPKERRCDGNR